MIFENTTFHLSCIYIQQMFGQTKENVFGRMHAVCSPQLYMHSHWRPHVTKIANSVHVCSSFVRNFLWRLLIYRQPGKHWRMANKHDQTCSFMFAAKSTLGQRTRSLVFGQTYSPGVYTVLSDKYLFLNWSPIAELNEKQESSKIPPSIYIFDYFATHLTHSLKTTDLHINSNPFPQPTAYFNNSILS